jgi:hypothetical protein
VKGNPAKGCCPVVPLIEKNSPTVQDEGRRWVRGKETCKWVLSCKKKLTSSAGWRKEAGERKGNPAKGCCPAVPLMEKNSPQVQDGGRTPAREKETLQRGAVLLYPLQQQKHHNADPLLPLLGPPAVKQTKKMLL